MTEWIQKVGAKWGLWELVWLRDVDGEVVIRIKRTDTWGRPIAIRVGPWFWRTRVVILEENGTLLNGCYVKEWGQWRP